MKGHLHMKLVSHITHLQSGGCSLTNYVKGVLLVMDLKWGGGVLSVTKCQTFCQFWWKRQSTLSQLLSTHSGYLQTYIPLLYRVMVINYYLASRVDMHSNTYMQQWIRICCFIYHCFTISWKPFAQKILMKMFSWLQLAFDNFLKHFL